MFIICICETLHPWNEANFVMVYDLFSVLLHFCKYFAEEFCIYVD
jgi:hypothetical protein